MLLSHHLPHLKALPNPYPTRTIATFHSPVPTRGPFPWPGHSSGNFKASPLLCSLRPRFSSYEVGSSAEDFNVELGRLLALLPEDMRRKASEHPELQDLIEVVMDLGRKPLARFPSGDFVLSDHPITMEEIQHATSQVGDFAVDNRAGISRTLHRISGIRNRKGLIIGLTCRVGRAVSGSANLLRDLVKDGGSLLLIGPPGVGKTTIIRDIARMLANEYEKRVMIVDTSNEIGGDGDIPHAGIGNARRMQVPHTDMQHKVLIEAVENHMPQVIVIDEIGTKLEAAAASTIAQRGIQLVATAHGVTIENLVMNPALEMLVGGVQFFLFLFDGTKFVICHIIAAVFQSVTLGDEEASRRGVQKSVLERKGPSTFTSGVEIISKTEIRIHRSLEATVDAVLSGRNPNFEVRKLNQGSADEFEPQLLARDVSVSNFDSEIGDDYEINNGSLCHEKVVPEEGSYKDEDTLCIFLYGIAEASVIQAMKQLKLDDTIEFTDNISEADVLLALQSKLKKNARLQAAAKSRGIPTYVSKATSTSSSVQIAKAIEALISDYADGFESYEPEAKANDSERIDALEEARIAIEQRVIPNGETVELLPRASNIILLQKDLIRKYNLKSERVSTDLGTRLRIFNFQSNKEDENAPEADDDDIAIEFGNFREMNDDLNGSAITVDRLPFLPD
ncbi:P-loop containing nucleoside triphosphatehydrolases superfamily protein [Striga asiatica]|uniref:P-loop containing nucleoside triphosphatehydrolases superfamily protein n=1 Tax=Striga asiatica TaxID=4170 RepID=A0A5A7RB38_STRAF|nr:P-loop containing nucleoside triphosphatehydrolases superfamily protein [Striga asiatica]